MAKFLKGNELNSEIEKIFEVAQSQIVLISPYIKLHDRYKASLKTKLDNPSLEIVILFGKNEDDVSKSMKINDLEFFKKFPNIEIRHEKRLHAKYYANESKAIMTSMNLYGYSQNNNIESGILMETSLKGSITGLNELDKNSWDYFKRVIEQSELLFKKQPNFEKKNILSATKYIGSEIIEDRTAEFFKEKIFKKPIRNEKPKEVILKKGKTGFCIRTGNEIPFSAKRPFSNKAFESWYKYQDEEYPEKYCHYSGEKSNGETTYARPILKKNWKKSQI